MEFRFNSIEEAIEDIKQGKMVIVVDDPNRENEGDLVMAAEKVTPDAINFMAKEGRGLICLSMLRERLEELDIPLMTQNNTDPNGTAFCLSIDAHPKYGTTTGISAYDRAVTIKLAVSPDATPQDFVRPGHVFPLMARPGGVLERTGHTEASVDLARLAGLYPAGVICEIMKEDGTMARLPDLIKFAKKYDLKIITIADLVQYRLKREKFVVREAEAHLPTKYGTFKIYGYKNTLDGSEHVALVMGDIDPDKPTLVRVHSECLTGDIFGSLRCDCQSQLHAALKTIASEGKGVLVYMRGHEGRGIGIINKIKAYRLQEEGYDTVEANHRLGFNADLRDFGTGAQILLDIGVRKMKLMTNNPRKIVALEGFGLEVVERIPLIIEPNPYNKNYLKAKKEHLGHIFEDLKGESCSIDLDQLKEEMDSKKQLMDINIREFSESDLDEVRDIIHQNFKNPWSDRMILSANPFSYKTVAVLNNTIVGFLSGEIIYDEAHILMIAVDKNFQGRGVGKKLLIDFIDECISSGVNSVFLEVSESNKKAVRFYSDFGFYVYGIREKYYTTGEDAFLMKLNL